MTTLAESFNSRKHFGTNKHTATCPNKVKNSGIKNLSVDDKSELFTCYEESLTIGQVRKD